MARDATLQPKPLPCARPSPGWVPAAADAGLPTKPRPRLRPCPGWAPVVAGAGLLIWPAIYNGYPIVFADTGTYLSQAIAFSLGWDRPPFYSLFLLPLHMTFSLWPVVLVQALLASHTLQLVRRVLLPGSSPWLLLPMVAGLSLLTWLPWLTSEIMPDLFTPLLVLVLSLLAQAPERMSRGERAWLVFFGAFQIAAQLSSIPLAVVLVLFLAALRRVRGPLALIRLAAPLALAVLALVAVNLAAFGRASVSPYGNVFLLARVIYDGPGMAVLRRDCPRSGWRLCPELDRFPPTSDDFLWLPDSPVMRAGGHKAVAADADAIIRAAVLAEPGRSGEAFLANWWEQLTRFRSGDGLEPWPDTVTPKIARHFPAAENAAYAAALQTRGALLIPPWLFTVHAVVALAGVVLCLLALRNRDLCSGFAMTVLFSLVANAAITGGLSTPHDRYGSRLMWLAPCIGVVAILRRRPA